MKTSIYNGFSIAMLVITRWYIKLFNYISQYPNKNPHDMVKNPWCLNTRCCGIGRCLAAELQPTAFGRQFHGQSCWWMRNRKKKSWRIWWFSYVFISQCAHPLVGGFRHGFFFHHIWDDHPHEFTPDFQDLKPAISPQSQNSLGKFAGHPGGGLLVSYGFLQLFTKIKQCLFYP
jgi:hypothetical protein